MCRRLRICMGYLAATLIALCGAASSGNAGEELITGAVAPHEELMPAVQAQGKAIFAGRDMDGVSDGSAVRAVVRSVQNVTISSELNARIKLMKFREGDAFREGDVLVQFDCAKTLAELDSAQAAFKSREVAYRSAAQMLQYQAAGTLAVDQARFDMEKAAADIRILETKHEACTILAPFDGRVVERLAQTFEVAQANQPLMRIAEATNTELALMVPSHWVGIVKPGSLFTVQIDETGATFPAIVKQIGGAIDPVSKSVRLIGEVSDRSASVAPGMSGTATFQFSEAAR